MIQPSVPMSVTVCKMNKLTGLLICGLAAAIGLVAHSQEVTPPSPGGKPAVRVEVDPRAGLELWQTMLGRLWIPAPGQDVMRHLQWEQAVEKVYHHPLVHVRPGDVVIDCGTHIGAFTRVALNEGASLVIAIEPEQANLAAFQRNFAKELKAGKVRLIPKGVLDAAGKLQLHLSKVGDSHSIVIPQNAGKDEAIEVTTLDSLADSLKLQRVDFIKLDIEGSEQKALQGARNVIRRFQPRLAVSSYHQKGDPAAICSIVWQVRADYLVVSKDLLESRDGTAVPKVLFFFR
jgi:FkbM family methyltransferase